MIEKITDIKISKGLVIIKIKPLPPILTGINKVKIGVNNPNKSIKQILKVCLSISKESLQLLNSFTGYPTFGFIG
jgi:hypothetical protein